MSFKDSKVVIVGCGNVGSTTAYTIINQGLAEEIVLIDVNKDKSYAEALDMAHSIYFMNRNINIHAGEYSDCKDADIVIITASAPMPKDSSSRLDMLAPSIKIIKSIVSSVMESGFNGIFLVISNPVDIMTYMVYKMSGLPKNQVIGSGTNLDSARLCCELADMYDLDSKSVSAYVCGEHGDSEIVSWHSAVIGGKSVENVMKDNPDRTKNITREDLQKQTIKAGWDIFNRKGNTCYGIAASAAAICKSILFNENHIYPVTVGLSGQYGIKNAWLSVPTIIDRTGAKEIVEIRLDPDEEKALRHSAELLESFYGELGL
ncbi:MAG: L-lactate dehydrogenase [Lachnospiraceae bacterium]|nr:L-lactate dehydrogenase [Lachnospiraceae bacterium]MCH4027583.1 L-lactate dehydrogenase [Lachnospiraceae bacterium]MCH4065423.1 L-lactate dehydrogenase [Lachnospiraceae bacterium]MCH4111463.1 L-lactate dehydrogenase [Lachnospiraceae bacterium]MCI1353059.1 L-lactate dehydrogenase [Lachnospiraceae bacterium]